MTERLVLRRPRLSDAGEIFQSYAQDPDVTRYVMWRPHTGLQQTQEFLAGCVAAWEGDNRFPFVITLKENASPIGMIEIHPSGSRCGAGYVIGKTHWGKGYTTEALKTLIEWVFTQPGVYRLDATCDVENFASYRVMEKAGMQREGILRRWVIHPNISPEPRDCYIYAIVKD
jgi:RimJ/RimL family protein N-acetyltransferase